MSASGGGQSVIALDAPQDVSVLRPLQRFIPRLDGREGTGHVVRLAATAGLLSALYALGAVLPFWFLGSPEAGAAFFPSAGLTLATLLLTSRRSWALWLAVIASTEIAVDLTHGQAARLAICFALANVLEPLAGATLIRWTRLRHRSLRWQMIGLVGCGALLGPLVGATIGATASVWFGSASGLFAIAGRWWLGDALGVIVIASCILAWAVPSPFDARARLGSIFGIAALAAVVTIGPAVLWQHPVLYAILPLLTVAAFVGGVRAVTTAGVGVAFAADWATITGRANRLLQPSTQQLVFVQIFLALTLLSALALAVEIADRRRGEHGARVADAARVQAEHAMVEIAEAERRSIALETHDIVGHGLNVMLIQAGAIRRVMNTDPELAKELLDSIESVGRAACDDLEIALALMHSRLETHPNRGLACVPELVAVVRAAGMSVNLDFDPGSREISRLVDWSAYRIVQEAVTNVTKHAPRASVHVVVRSDSDDVHVSVVDDGGGAPPPRAKAKGRGLIGMSERVNALGGQIEMGPEQHGFAVRARIPLRPIVI